MFSLIFSWKIIYLSANWRLRASLFCCLRNSSSRVWSRWGTKVWTSPHLDLISWKEQKTEWHINIYSINFLLSCACKVHIFWEGHKILRIFHRRFVLCSASQIYGGLFLWTYQNIWTLTCFLKYFSPYFPKHWSQKG